VRIEAVISLGAAFALAARLSAAEAVDVRFENGLLSIQCKDAPLASVFERISEVSGVELTLEDAVKSKKLSANLADLPVSMAISRLLEGAGVNYIVMMDPYDWGKVGKIFVGGGGGGPARSAGPSRVPAMPQAPEEEVVDEPESFEEDLAELESGDAVEPAIEGDDVPQSPDEFGAAEDPEAFGNPPGSGPLPDFLPPAQSFPRSSFTPGLPRQNQRPQGQTQTQQPQGQEPDPSNTPPATFPFTDPFGRPIPVPPGMNQAQQQQRRQQQTQQRQQ
jgi:hypothetical protein